MITTGPPAIDDDPLDPAVVLGEAIAQLRSGGHLRLAADVERVDAYLRYLAVAQTELALASDRLVDEGRPCFPPTARRTRPRRHRIRSSPSCRRRQHIG